MKKQIVLFSIVVAVVAFLAIGNTFMAQASTNSFISPTHCLDTSDGVYECLDSDNPNGSVYQFQDISGTNPHLIFTNYDDGMTHVTMPFSSTLYDLTSDKLTISMNGAIKFGSFINNINGFNIGLPTAPSLIEYHGDSGGDDMFSVEDGYEVKVNVESTKPQAEEIFPDQDNGDF